MTLDDISHGLHVGHLQDRIRELEAKLRDSEAECLRWSERWEAFVTGDFRAMEERAEAAERELARVRLGDGGTQRITEAYRALARSMKIDPSPANAERVRDEAAAAVALRDEMRGERDKARTLAGTIAERAEKAEREREEARGTGRGLISLVMDLAPYPPEVAEAVLALVDGARAALGEKP